MNALTPFVKNRECGGLEGEFGALLKQQGVLPFKQLFQMATEPAMPSCCRAPWRSIFFAIDEKDLEDGFGRRPGSPISSPCRKVLLTF